MDIDARRERLDEAARKVHGTGAAWYGDIGEACPSCGVDVPAGYQLALPESDVAGCLRCLEHRAHMMLGGLAELPDDLAGVGGQSDAMRQVAEGFRAHIRAAERGREAPSRRQAQSRWAAQSGWEFTPDWEPPSAEAAPKGAKSAEAAPKWAKDADKSSRWSEKGWRTAPQSAPEGGGNFRRAARPSARAAPPPRPTHSPPQPPGPADILGIEGGATRAEIIAAFRRRALLLHPDYGGSAEAFRELVEARDALLRAG